MTNEFRKMAVLIPNYNGEEFIIDTVNQFQNLFTGFAIIVVDDCSIDNSTYLLEGSNCILIKREVNGGFAAAVNSGFRYLKKNNYDVAVVANSDVIIDMNVAMEIRNSIKIFYSNPKISVLGYCESGSTEIKQNDEISGFLFAIRLSIIDIVGYFDETFHMYGEEQDYFRRVLSNGYNIKQTNIYVDHRKEGSSGGSLRSSWLAIRNAIYLEMKGREWWGVVRVYIVLLLTINRLYFPSVNGQDPSYQRVIRPGIFRGNIYLINALIWNLKNILFQKGINNEQSKHNI